MRFLRLCLLIFVFLRFLSDPIMVLAVGGLRGWAGSVDDFVERVFHNPLRAH